MALLRIALVLAMATAIAATAGCFSPRQPPCAFSCADDGLCPSGYSCQADGVCHRDDGQGTCDLPSQIDAGDAGADVPGDAAGDDASDAS
jgi:hypothetical protein